MYCCGVLLHCTAGLDVLHVCTAVFCTVLPASFPLTVALHLHYCPALPAYLRRLHLADPGPAGPLTPACLQGFIQPGCTLLTLDLLDPYPEPGVCKVDVLLHAVARPPRGQLHPAFAQLKAMLFNSRRVELQVRGAWGVDCHRVELRGGAVVH